MEKFVPLQDFYSPELKSQYCAGLVYTIRPQDAALHALVHEKWLPADMVSLDVARVQAVMAGAGAVAAPAVTSAPVAVVSTDKDEKTGRLRSFLREYLSWL